jgi:3-methyladenine DNA glycosylase/8-oxoguanine DNA glycosylase
MNRKLCRVFGRKSASGLYSFPTAARLARARPATLRARCSVGYRDARMVELAKIFAAAERGRTGVLNLAWVEDPATPEEELFEALQELPGVGPYAAANIMQLLGRYTRLPLDTESVRHGRTVLGYKGTSARLMKRLHAHYRPFGEHRFRSYWFELWRYYEAKRGPSWTWERETTGKTFTAALLD